MLKLLALYFAVIYITYVHFLAVMNLRVQRDTGRLNKYNRPADGLILGVGLVFDAFLNFIYSLPLLELPQYQHGEVLLTYRFKRLKKINARPIDRYRAAQANFWCNNFLKPSDPTHCD